MVAMVKTPKLAALKMTPLPHQQRLSDRLTDQPGMIAHHGVGTGKSFSTINAAEQHDLPLVAVVPASLRNNFKKEIQQSGFSKPHMVLSYEEASKKLEDPEFRQFAEKSLVAYDEAQRGGKHDTQRSKLLGAIPAKKKLFLTGTPMRNAPHEIAPMINAIAPGSLPKTQAEFDNKFLSPREVPVGFWGRLRGAKPGKEYTPTNLMEFEKAIRGKVDYYDAVDRSEYPSHSESIVEVPMTDRQHASYEFTMGRYPALAYKVRHGLPLNKQEQKNFRAFMSGPRQVSNHPGGFNTSATDEDAPKIVKAVDEVYQRTQADPDYRGVTYSSFLDTGVRPMMRELDRRGIRHAVFTGEQGDDERKRIIEDYNSGKIQQLLISGAGAEGLDLKGTRLMQVLEPHWQEELINQVKGRGIRYQSHAHLPEKDRHVEVQRFHSVPRPGFFGRMFGKTRGGERSVDEYLYERAKRKQEITKPFLDIMRGEAAKTSEAQGWLIEIEMDEATKEAGFRDAAEYAKRVVNRYRESLGRLCNGPTCFQGARKIQDALSERGIESRRSIWAYPGTHAVTELPTGEALHYGKQNSKGDMGFSRVPPRFIPTLSVGGYGGVSVRGKRLLKPPAGPDKSGPTTPDLAVGQATGVAKTGESTNKTLSAYHYTTPEGYQAILDSGVIKPGSQVPGSEAAYANRRPGRGPESGKVYLTPHDLVVPGLPMRLTVPVESLGNWKVQLGGKKYEPSKLQEMLAKIPDAQGTFDKAEERAFRRLLQIVHDGPVMLEKTGESTIKTLLRAKSHSDARNYDAKQFIMRKLISERQEEFEIDSEKDGIVGLTHGPTGFRMHLPKTTVLGFDLATQKAASAAGAAWMDFPENELPAYRSRLSRGQPAYTTRVSAERGQYRVGQAVDSPLGRLRISEVNSHGAGDPHPFDSELTPGQRRQIQGAFDVIRFEPIDKARTVTASAEPLPNPGPPAQPILTGENAHWHEWRPDATVKVPAFLFDLDDTLVTTPGSSYPKEPGQQQVLPRRLEVLAQLHEKGYKLIGITNRSDYLGDTTLTDVITSLKETMGLLGGLLDDVLFIPYYCDKLNKPSPLMIDTAIERYCLDRENCIYVGDNDDDREAAKNADVTYAHPNTFFDADFGLIPPASPRVVLDTPDGWEADDDLDRRTFFFDDWRKSKDFITALCQEAMFREVVPNTLNIGGSQVEVYLPRGNHGFCHWINALYEWGEFTAWGEDLVDDASWAANRKPRCFSAEMPETRHEVPAPKPAPASIRRAAEDRLSAGFFTVTDLVQHEPAPRRHHGRVQGFPRWKGII